MQSIKNLLRKNDQLVPGELSVSLDSTDHLSFSTARNERFFQADSPVNRLIRRPVVRRWRAAGNSRGPVTRAAEVERDREIEGREGKNASGTRQEADCRRWDRGAGEGERKLQPLPIEWITWNATKLSLRR